MAPPKFPGDLPGRVVTITSSTYFRIGRVTGTVEAADSHTVLVRCRGYERTSEQDSETEAGLLKLPWKSVVSLLLHTVPLSAYIPSVR